MTKHGKLGGKFQLFSKRMFASRNLPPPPSTSASPKKNSAKLIWHLTKSPYNTKFFPTVSTPQPAARAMRRRTFRLCKTSPQIFSSRICKEASAPGGIWVTIKGQGRVYPDHVRVGPMVSIVFNLGILGDYI